MKPRTYLLLCALVGILAACAVTPEAKLVQGYQIVSGAAKTTLVLVTRDVITPGEGENVADLADAARAMLDAGKERLKVCRAAGNEDCSVAVANVQLGAGVLQQLEDYLAKITPKERK